MPMQSMICVGSDSRQQSTKQARFLSGDPGVQNQAQPRITWRSKLTKNLLYLHYLHHNKRTSILPFSHSRWKLCCLSNTKVLCGALAMFQDYFCHILIIKKIPLHIYTLNKHISASYHLPALLVFKYSSSIVNCASDLWPDNITSIFHFNYNAKA